MLGSKLCIKGCNLLLLAMCGHGMIGHGLVEVIIQRLQEGGLDIDEAI